MPRPVAPSTLVLIPAKMSVYAEALLDRRFRPLRLVGERALDAKLEKLGSSIEVAAVGAAAGFPDHLWDRLPNLRLIAVHGVGLDGVDLARAKDRGVSIQSSPAILADDVADLAIGLWLALSRKIVQADAYVRSDQWRRGEAFPLTYSASGKRAGIVGLGHIGAGIGKRLESFGASIAYTARSEKPDCPYQFCPTVRELAERTDVLFLAASGGAETIGLVGPAELEALGASGLLINVARGSIVDEDALLNALESAKLGGAGLDVFDNEPAISRRFAVLDNVLLQPHQGSATHETRKLMAQILIDQIDHYFQSRRRLS